MPSEPSEQLVSTLARLKLATPEQVRAVAPRVRRLAAELPEFESVWVDALAQAQVLTPFQAARINGGAAESLVCGPYLLMHALPSAHYASCFAAQHSETAQRVRLYLVARPQVELAQCAREARRLIERLAPLGATSLPVIDDAGIAPQGFWAVCPHVSGVSAAEWMVENGRLPPPIVLHIAREMLAQLAQLEARGVVHGDLGAAGLLLQANGQIALPMPGLRGLVRPHEGYGFLELQVEAYDYLAPERIADGAAPSTASDLYACGCLWWHLLTGRAPFAGGNSLARLKAAHAARLTDVRLLAPDAPPELVRAIEVCTAREVSSRPRSASEVLKILGPVERTGAASLAACVRHPEGVWWVRPRRPLNRSRRPAVSTLATAAAAVVLLCMAATWPLWRGKPGANAIASAKSAPAQTPPETRSGQEPAEARHTAGEQPKDDELVKLAAALVPEEFDRPEDLVLPAGRTLRLQELKLTDGQRVCGPPGKRACVSVPPDGLRVDHEDVSFESIDFIWEASVTGRPADAMAMLVVEAAAVEFRGCTFSSEADAPPTAIHYVHRANASGPLEVRLSDCVVSGVSAVVDCSPGEAMTISLNNTLCVAAGPIVRLARAPRSEQALRIVLTRVTTRGDSAVLECRYSAADEQPGTVTIEAVDCALDTMPRGALIVLSGNQSPERILRSVVWTGHGSLMTPQVAMAQWRGGPKRQQVLSEEAMDIAGLVRSEVRFAGSAEGPPANSRLIDWQVPLRSADPPGAAVEALAVPPVR